MSAFFSALCAALLFLLKFIGVLLLIILALVILLLLCPFCADINWNEGVLTVKAGALGLTFPVFRYPKPEPTGEPQQPKGFFGKLKAKFSAWRKKRKAEKKPKPQKKKKASAHKKAKITLDIICTILRGAGTLIKAVFGALRITKINICLGIRGDDPAAAALTYGKLNAWLYPALGFIDKFIYLDFEQLRVVPDFGGETPAVQDHVSLRVSARALFIVIAALRVLYEFWREKVLDVFL